MDEEPVARALLVAGVTCLTVGLVTLALGIVFVVVDLHEVELLVIWVVTIASGVASIIGGAQISSFTCYGRSSRPISVCYLIFFVGSALLGIGLHIAVIVLSSFHVMKDGSRKEIFIFFLASSTIQMAALVVAPLLFTCNPKIRGSIIGSKQTRKNKESLDNYGFIGDGEMWCSLRPTKGNLTRWPAMEHLESVTARSSTSSIGSIHPGHYIAGDHHHKFIRPSSEEANSTASSQSTVFETSKSQNGTKKQNGGVIYAEIHPTKPNTLSQGASKTSERPNFPVRPPRLKDSFNSPSDASKAMPMFRKPEKIAISTVSQSYSPLASPTRRRIFLYDTVEMDISSPKAQNKKVNFRNEQNSIVNSYEDSWVPRKGIFGHNLHGINVNGLQSLGPSTSLPLRNGAPNNVKKKNRPKEPPPDVPNGRYRGSSVPITNGDAYQRFIVGDWEDLNTPIDGIKLQATSTPKHSRKVTFLESET